MSIDRSTRFAQPLALALLLATTLAACNRHDNDDTANGAGDTSEATETAGAVAPNGTVNAPAGGDTATTSDNSAMSDTSGTQAGTAMDNTAAGTTTGDMSNSGSATPASTTSTSPPASDTGTSNDQGGTPPQP